MNQSEPTPSYGARVTGMSDGVILISQTRKSGPNRNDRYVVDHNSETGKARERFVNPDDDAAIAQAIRDALAGTL